MQNLFPDSMVWLSTDPKYLQGAEAGAVLMLTQVGAAIIKVKINDINLDQVLVGAACNGYHVNIDAREDGWAHLTLTVKGKANEVIQRD